MKKLLLALCFICALTLVAQAGDEKGGKKRPEQTAEQKLIMKDMLAKYDANKDGKLDKTERAKISTEDKAKMEKAGLTHKKKDAGATEAAK